MDIVQKKYDGFIEFIQNNIKNNMYINALSSVSCIQLLNEIKKLKDKTPDEIVGIVSSKFNIDLTSYSQEIVDKFKRYLEYFQKVSLTL